MAFSAFFRSPSELASTASLSMARKVSSCKMSNDFGKSQGFDRKSPGFAEFLAGSTWPLVFSSDSQENIMRTAMHSSKHIEGTRHHTARACYNNSKGISSRISNQEKKCK